MQHWIVVSARPPGGDREAFLRRHREVLARWRALPLVRGIVAYEALPDDAPLAAQQGRPARPQRVDAVTALALGPAAEPPWRAGSAPAPGLVEHAFAVEEVVHWDDAPEVAEGEIRSGLTLLYFVHRRPDLPREAFVARYREGHTPLARVHHPGIACYAQRFALPPQRPGAPPLPCDALAALHFASERDLRERFYRDAGSPAVIADDVRAFLDLSRGFALVTRERLLKRAAAYVDRS